ncbi:hypothetical protein ACFXI6_49535 [Streptomyces mirabilis]|uniref:hypothetical protein n=1 Tax=Streptomyces mirabilis TaxID=68239 RepID=UPI00369B6FF4
MPVQHVPLKLAGVDGAEERRGGRAGIRRVGDDDVGQALEVGRHLQDQHRRRPATWLSW